MLSLFSGRKAALDLMNETTVKVVLSVGALLVLTIMIVKISNVFVPDTEEATKRNFEQLVASIKNMEEGASFSSYPLFVDEDYAIVGYQSSVSAIGGTCSVHSITSPYENTKPEQCGIGEEGCLCLCENTGDFATLCRKNDQVEQCATTETFGKDYSFTGGIYTDGSGSCSFALVFGTDKIQNIYLKKTEDAVRICTKECDSNTPSQDALVSSATQDAPSIATTTQNILIIGDSQTMGDYGSTLYELFKADASSVNEYAVCGATPSYYLKGSSIPSCAARYIYDDGSSDGSKKTVTSGTTPLLSSLLEDHTPDLVFVTFASNMLYAYSDTEKIHETSITSAVRAFADHIVSAGASCVWVGPPQGPRYTDLEEYRTFKNIIKDSAENSGCTFIDSEEYTAFAFCGEDTFGCASGTDPHFSNYGTAGQAVAEAWAEGVYSIYEGTYPLIS